MNSKSVSGRTRSVLLGVAALSAASLAASSPQQPTDGRGAADNRKSDVTNVHTSSFTVDDRDWLVFDTPGDGSIWAASDAYKVRFDKNGVMYVPFLGSTAPRNYPIQLDVAEVLVGGQPLSFVDDVAPARDEDTIVFDRGSFVEQYDIGPSAMEQLFKFVALPGDGDLTIKLAVQTELLLTEGPDALGFTNDRGTVRYSRAIVYDANGAVVPAPTAFADGSIRIRVPGAFLGEAVFPITIDPVITTFAIETHDENDRVPNVAYNSSNGRYNVVWEKGFSGEDGDVYSELYTSFGTVVAGSRVSIDTTSSNWRAPQTAGNNLQSQFIIVAATGNTGGRVIRGRMRAAFSNVVGPTFQISPGSYDEFNPGVGGDPNTTGPTNYCVVWEGAVSSGDHDIFARRVDPFEVLSLVIAVDNSAGTFDSRPSISKCNGAPPKATQAWNIVWQRRFSPTDEDIHGAQIGWNGVVTTASFLVNPSPSDDRFPVVTSPLDGFGGGPRPYLVAYQRSMGGHSDIVGSAMMGSTFLDFANLTELEGSDVSAYQLHPSVDSCGTSFTLAYTEQDQTTLDYGVYAATFCLHDETLVFGEGHQNLASFSDGGSWPDIVAAHSGGSTSDRLMVTWTDINTGTTGDIFGGLYDVENSCPLNDDCDHAFAVFPGTVMVGDLFHGSNDGATVCGPGGQPDVWYTFTAPYDGRLRINTCGTHGGPGDGLDTVLSLHSDCPGDSANTLDCNDDSYCGYDSSVSACMNAGQTVKVRVASFGPNLGLGRFNLEVEYSACDGDTDFDGDIDVDDLINVIVSWGCTSGPYDCIGDADCDGQVNVDDLINGVILNWGSCP